MKYLTYYHALNMFMFYIRPEKNTVIKSLYGLGPYKLKSSIGWF